MINFTDEEINTLCRAIELNLNRLNKLLDQVEHMAPKNRLEMENKIERLNKLYDKVTGVSND